MVGLISFDSCFEHSSELSLIVHMTILVLLVYFTDGRVKQNRSVLASIQILQFLLNLTRHIRRRVLIKAGETGLELISIDCIILWLTNLLVILIQ